MLFSSNLESLRPLLSQKTFSCSFSSFLSPGCACIICVFLMVSHGSLRCCSFFFDLSSNSLILPFASSYLLLRPSDEIFILVIVFPTHNFHWLFKNHLKILIILTCWIIITFEKKIFKHGFFWSFGHIYNSCFSSLPANSIIWAPSGTVSRNLFFFPVYVLNFLCLWLSYKILLNTRHL